MSSSSKFQDLVKAIQENNSEKEDFFQTQFIPSLADLTITSENYKNSQLQYEQTLSKSTLKINPNFQGESLFEEEGMDFSGLECPLELKQGEIVLNGTAVIIEKIGQGSEATVYLAKNLKNQKEIAIKQYLRPSYEQEEIAKVKAQFINFQKLINPHLVQYHDISVTEKKIYADEITVEVLISMDYVKNNLFDYVEEYKKKHKIKFLPIDMVKQISFNILQGISFLHSKKIMHRDLKLQNILLNDDINSLKITDFGFAITLKTAYRTGTVLGSPGLIAPEVLTQEKCSLESDIWSFGCIVYQLITGEIPFNDIFQQHGFRHTFLFANPLECARDELLDIIYDRKYRKLLHVMRECWRENITHRITAKELLTHEAWK